MVTEEDLRPFKVPYFTSYPSIDVPTSIANQLGINKARPPGVMALLAANLPVDTPSQEQGRLPYVPDLVSINNVRLGFRMVLYNPVSGVAFLPDANGRMPAVVEGPVTEGDPHGTSGPLQLGGEDPTGDVARLQTDASKNLKVILAANSGVDTGDVGVPGHLDLSYAWNEEDTSGTSAILVAAPGAGSNIRIYALGISIGYDGATFGASIVSYIGPAGGVQLLALGMPQGAGLTGSQQLSLAMPAGCYIDLADNTALNLFNPIHGAGQCGVTGTAWYETIP